MQALERHPWAFLMMAVLACVVALYTGHRAVIGTERNAITQLRGR